MTTTHAPILQLPTELLLAIIDYALASPDSPFQRYTVDHVRLKTLWSLCLTCRSIYHVAVALLYADLGICLPTKPDEHRDGTRRIVYEDGKPVALLPLVRTVVSRPSLAAKVKLLIIRLGSEEPFHYQPLRDRYPTDIYRCLRELFTHLLNVIELDFGSDGHYTYFWTDIIEDSSFNNGKFLPSLQVFRVAPQSRSLLTPLPDSLEHFTLINTKGGDCYDYAQHSLFNITDYQSLFNQPSIHTMLILHARAMPASPRWVPLRLNPGSVNLTSLELLGCCLSPVTLTSILQACNSLKILRLALQEVDTSKVSYDDWNYRQRRRFLSDDTDSTASSDDSDLIGCFSVKEMQATLDHCNSTLEELSLVFSNETEPGSLCFKHFARLTKLLVQYNSIMTDCQFNPELPRSLKHLTLVDFWSDIDHPVPSKEEDMWDPIFDVQTHTDIPNLEYLRVIGHESQPCHVHLLIDYRKDLATEVSYLQPTRDGGWMEHKLAPRSIAWTHNGLHIEVIDQCRPHLPDLLQTP